MLLGDVAIEQGSVIIGRDGHGGLGFRHDHFCSMLNLKSNGRFISVSCKIHCCAKMAHVVLLCCGDAPVQQIPTENKHKLEVGNTTGIWQSGQRGEPRGGNLGIFSSRV